MHAISRQYANNLVRAGKATRELETIVSKNSLPLPRNEAQVRELLKVPGKEERAAIYKSALQIVHGDVKLLTAGVIRTEVGKSARVAGIKNVTPGKTANHRLKEAKDIVEKLEDALAKGESIEGLLAWLKTTLSG